MTACGPTLRRRQAKLARSVGESPTQVMPSRQPGSECCVSRIGPWNIERLSDVENTNLTPRAAAQMSMHNELVSKGRRAFSAMSRCWPGGPAQLLFNAEPLYFIQTPREVWILWQRDHLVRRVFLNRETSTALSAIEGQRKALRASPVSETRRPLFCWPPSRRNAPPWPRKALRIETEATPIRYVAELVGADTPQTSA